MSRTVDIVIAARNEARHIESCLRALQSQTYPQELLRIIVVDNGSVDETIRVTRACGVEVHGEAKPGPAAARNLGLRMGSGELVGFLDAHCLPNREWIEKLVAAFDDEEVGGAQASLENRADSLRIQTYLQRSGDLSNSKIVADTIYGRHSLLPWALSGNSMFRKKALIDAGGFDEKLHACEDVDLSWKVVLRGYRLVYVADAKCIHTESRSWHSFVKKGFTYGQGAAELSLRYRRLGSTPGLRMRGWLGLIQRAVKNRTPESILSALYFSLGYTYRRFASQLKQGKAMAIAELPVQFRSPFEWREGEALRVSNRWIYWCIVEPDATILVDLRQANSRMTLEGSANLIWKALVKAKNEQTVCDMIVQTFDIPVETARYDLRDFIDQLLASGAIERA